MAFRDLAEAEIAGDFPDRALVRRKAPRVHEHDRDGIVALRAGLSERGAHALNVRRSLDRSVGEHALVDLDHA